jgi:uncharacterized membrane protein YcaP (DUF421 family)
METVLRAAGVYLFLFVLFRATGKRSVAEIDTFDFVLLLIISEATQQALVGRDYSLVNAGIVIVTLVALEAALSLVHYWFPRLAKVLDDVPLVLVENGKPIKRHMDKERVDEESILEAARELQGLERMDQIKFAVLERNGHITIIPRKGQG